MDLFFFCVKLMLQGGNLLLQVGNNLMLPGGILLLQGGNLMLQVGNNLMLQGGILMLQEPNFVSQDLVKLGVQASNRALCLCELSLQGLNFVVRDLGLSCVKLMLQANIRALCLFELLLQGLNFVIRLSELGIEVSDLESWYLRSSRCSLTS